MIYVILIVLGALIYLGAATFTGTWIHRTDVDGCDKADEPPLCFLGAIACPIVLPCMLCYRFIAVPILEIIQKPKLDNPVEPKLVDTQYKVGSWKKDELSK